MYLEASNYVSIWSVNRVLFLIVGQVLFLIAKDKSMVYSNYVKQRILYLSRTGKTYSPIVDILALEGRRVTKPGICYFLKKFKATGSITRKPGTGRKPTKTRALLDFIDTEIEKDDEISLADLRTKLVEKGINVSISSIHRWKEELGWTSKGTKYCQMIREGNVAKRLDWAKANIEDINLDDLIFTDETTVQLENHRRTTSYKKGRKPRYKPRPKHPTKLHVWAGISARGRTGVCIFEGKMNAPLFKQIIEKTLVPFIKEVYPEGCRLIQDNDPKHCSRMAQDYYADSGVDWWRTPAESPDLNPIENLWHKLKEFIRRKAKPKSKQELLDTITAFWETVDIAKCQRYIYHLKKVIPAVIENQGKATGY